MHRAESADGFPSLATAAGTKVVKRDPITKKPRSRKVRMFRVCDRVALLNHMSACCCAVTALFNDMFVVRGGVGEAEVRPAGECAFFAAMSCALCGARLVVLAGQGGREGRWR